MRLPRRLAPRAIPRQFPGAAAPAALSEDEAAEQPTPRPTDLFPPVPVGVWRRAIQPFEASNGTTAHSLRISFVPLPNRCSVVSGYTAEQLSQPNDDLVASLVRHVRVDGPDLLGSEVARSASADGDWRPGPERSVQLGTNRHYVAIQVSGDIDLLEHWPDQASADLQPVDVFGEDPWIEDPPGAPYDEAAAVLRHDQRLAQKLWFLGRRNENGPRALYTFIDLTSTEEQEVAAGHLDARAIVDARRGGVEPIVRAIADQTRGFFDSELPKILSQAIEQRRSMVEARAAVRANLTWPVGWKFDTPRLVEEPTIDEIADSSLSLSVEHRSRLDPATFEDVQRTIRVGPTRSRDTRLPSADCMRTGSATYSRQPSTHPCLVRGARFTREVASRTYSSGQTYSTRASPPPKSSSARASGGLARRAPPRRSTSYSTTSK